MSARQLVGVVVVLVALQCRSAQLGYEVKAVMCVVFEGSGSDINATW